MAIVLIKSTSKINLHNFSINIHEITTIVPISYNKLDLETLIWSKSGWTIIPIPETTPETNGTLTTALITVIFINLYTFVSLLSIFPYDEQQIVHCMCDFFVIVSPGHGLCTSYWTNHVYPNSKCPRDFMGSRRPFCMRLKSLSNFVVITVSVDDLALPGPTASTSKRWVSPSLWCMYTVRGWYLNVSFVTQATFTDSFAFTSDFLPWLPWKMLVKWETKHDISENMV